MSEASDVLVFYAGYRAQGIGQPRSSRPSHLTARQAAAWNDGYTLGLEDMIWDADGGCGRPSPQHEIQVAARLRAGR